MTGDKDDMDAENNINFMSSAVDDKKPQKQQKKRQAVHTPNRNVQTCLL